MNKVHALFWFKAWVEDEESEFWKNLLELKRLLDKYEYHVDIIRTNRPGYIEYQDDYQIAAVPFADTF